MKKVNLKDVASCPGVPTALMYYVLNKSTAERITKSLKTKTNYTIWPIAGAAVRNSNFFCLII